MVDHIWSVGEVDVLWWWWRVRFGTLVDQIWSSESPFLLVNWSWKTKSGLPRAPQRPTSTPIDHIWSVGEVWVLWRRR